MIATLYRPIFNTWIVFMIALMVGLVVWITGVIVGLGGIFDPEYTDFPSPLLMVLICAVAVGAITFIWFFMKRPVLTAITIIAFPIAIYVVVILLDWVLGTWGSKVIVLMIPVALGIFTGIQLMLFIRKRVAAGVWITFALIIVFAGIVWWASYIDSDLLALGILLYYGAAVGLCLGYAVVYVIYTIYIRRRLGV
jgi:hypothetical protein